MKQKPFRCSISEHAWQRWKERSGVLIKRAKLARMVSDKLNEALGPGLVFDRSGIGLVEVQEGLWAVVDLSMRVVTFLESEREMVG